MKKRILDFSLAAALLGTIAAFSFPANAAAQTSADFTDLKDLDAATKAKFDAMISAGIFNGVSDTTFGLKDEMNRAQFAKVAALITGIEVNKDLKTSSFSDVKSDDAANGYALPYIEALKTAGITEGYGEGTYNPAGKVTKEQLATFLVRVLGKDAEAKTLTGNDSTVSDWAQGYVAEALALKVLENNNDGKFGGQANATRDLLLTGAYEAKAQYVAPGKVSLTDAKPIGVKKISVTLNKPVDTAQAKLTVSKGNFSVAWSDDKKSAVLTFDDNLAEGDYTVTLSGLEAASVDRNTASLTVEAEKVTKIEFTNPSDTIPYAKQVVIKFKAVNQYGEAVQDPKLDLHTDVSANMDLNLMAVVVDTTGMQQGVSVVPISLIEKNSGVTASKNFTVGVAPIPTKLELKGSLRDLNGKEVQQAEWSGNYHVNFDAYDQYGNLIIPPTSNLSSGVNAVVAPSLPASIGTVVVAHTGEPGTFSVPFTMPSGGKSGDYTVTLYVGPPSVSLTFHVATDQPEKVVVPTTPTTPTTPASEPAPLLDISNISFGSNGPGFGNIAGVVTLPEGATQLMISTSSSSFATPVVGDVMSGYTPCVMSGSLLQGFCNYSYNSETYYVAFAATDATGKVVAFATTLPMSGTLLQPELPELPQPGDADVTFSPVQAGPVTSLTLTFNSPELSETTLENISTLISSVTVKSGGVTTPLTVAQVEWDTLVPGMPQLIITLNDPSLFVMPGDTIEVTFSSGALIDSNNVPLTTNVFETTIQAFMQGWI